ncbi:MAG: hypothetical protein RR052_05810 [Oscillospiraceae bacterium]
MDNLFNVKPIIHPDIVPVEPYTPNDSRAAAIAPVVKTDKGNKSKNSTAHNAKGEKSSTGSFDKNDCETCKNRKYVDGSNDAGVSFKTPSKIQGNVASAVMAHEQQHVSHNKAKAARTGSKIISQSVSLHTGICPECGRAYISGGTTRTVSRSSSPDTDEVLKNLQAQNTVGKEDAKTDTE